MTSLLTILSVLGAVVVCWLMAKYNKNDNLFWILLVSLLAGMAGGAIFNKLNDMSKNEEKNVNFEQVYNPTQVSQALYFCEEPGKTLTFKVKPVGQVTETPAFGIEVNVAPSKVYRGEIRDQPPFKPFDTS